MPMIPMKRMWTKSTRWRGAFISICFCIRNVLSTRAPKKMTKRTKVTQNQSSKCIICCSGLTSFSFYSSVSLEHRRMRCSNPNPDDSTG
jgi:hypothetical protein